MRLVGRPHDLGAVGERAHRRRHLVADERVAAPALLATPVQPHPPAGRPGPVDPRIPERVVVDPAGDADGLQIRPRILGYSVNQVDHLHAAVQEPVVARIALGHRRMGPVRRERQPFDLPGRLVQRAGGARIEVQPDDVRRVPPGSSRWIDGCDRDGQSISVPIDLPDVRVGRPDLRAVAGRQVEHEQAAARFSRAQDRGVGRRLGAVHRSRAPVQPVAPGIGHQDQQTRPVARPRHRLCRSDERADVHGFLTGDHRVRKLVTRSDPIREERESRPVRRPHRRPVAPRPARERGRLPVTLYQVEVARLERSDVRHGGVQRERDAGPVRRERELRRRPHVEQATRGRGASFIDLAHPLTAPDDSRSTSPNGYDRSTIPFGPVGHRNGLGGSRYLSQPPWGEGGIARRCGPAHAAPCPSGPSLSMEEGHMGLPPAAAGGSPISLIHGGRRSALRADRRFGARREPRTPPSCPLREGCGSGIRPPQAPHAHASRRDRYALPWPLPRVRG